MIIYSDVLNKEFANTEECLEAERLFREEQEKHNAEVDKAKNELLGVIRSAIEKQKAVMVDVKNAADIMISLQDEDYNLNIDIDDDDDDVYRVVCDLIRMKVFADFRPW